MKRLRRWLSGLLAAVMAVSLLPMGVVAMAAEADPWSGYTFKNISVTYRVRGSKYAGEETAQVPYHPGLFLQDANTLSPDLARLGAVLSAASYGIDVNSYCDVGNLYGALQAMGFTTDDKYRATYNRKLTIDDNDYVGYTVAERTVEWQGEEYMVYCVPIRGTYANAEWYSDFNLGDGDTHLGFYLAAAEVYNDLCTRIEANQEQFGKANTVIYLTGHSRGAAVANLIAGWLTKSGSVAKGEHIFAYTYACPAVSKHADRSLQNIHNFNNPGDLIPLLPLKLWGYERNGQTYDTVDNIGWDNLGYQFHRLTGETFASERSSQNYLALINDFLPTVEDFQNPKMQVVFNAAAWTLSGGVDTTFAEAVVKSGLYAAAYTLEDLQKSENISAWSHSGADKLVQEYESHVQWLREREEELRAMNEAEFAAFLEQNADRIAAIQLITEMAIDTVPGVSENVEKLEKMAADVRDFADKIDNIAPLLFDENGNILTKIYHGHTDIVYVLWMNARYYGYRGWYGYDGAAMAADVLENCYSIGDSCFESCAGAFNFPRIDNVRFLGDRVCYGASGLRGAVTIPSGVKTVGDRAFYQCWDLTELTLSDGVTSVGEYAFYFCRSLKTVTIPQTTTRIADNAFSGCTGLTSVTMPAALTFDSNNDGAFFGCSAIERVVLTGTGAMAASAVNYTPWGRATGEVSVVLEEGIASIPDSAFSGQNTLVEVTIPQSVTRIGKNAFSGCTALERADLPGNLTYLGENAFSGCRNLQELTLPETLNAVSRGAFSGCSGLQGTLVIPESVTGVGDNAFSGCTGLTSVTMPAALTFDSNNDGAFYGCAAIERVVLTGTGAMAASAVNYTPWGRATGEVSVVLEEGIASIPDSAFSGQNTLVEVTIPKSVTRIGKNAFSGCTALERADLPGNLTYLGENAFSGCRGLKVLTLPKTLTTINKGTFYNCSGLTGALVIPDNITYIGDNAFSGCGSITELTLPAALTFDSNNDGAFFGCTAISRVVLTGTGAMASTVANYAPWGRAGGEVSVELQEGITSIPDRAFNNCYRLVRLRLPSTLKSVGANATTGCIDLYEVLYHGSESRWAAVTVGKYNDPLKNAALYCNGSRMDTGSMGEDRDVRWQYRGETGALTLAGDVAVDSPVIAAAYRGGKLVEVKLFTCADDAGVFGAGFDSMTLFWLDEGWVPLWVSAMVELR